MLSEKEAFEQLRAGTLSEKDAIMFIDFYMDMKPIWKENGKRRLLKQAFRKDKMMTGYFIDKFIMRKETALA